MTIIYLHGFSSGAASHKAQLLQQALAPIPMLIVNYSSHQPEKAIDTISATIDAEKTDAPDAPAILMGSSLGGFYAQHLAARRDDIDKVVMINPALDPQPPLKSWIGRNTNMVTGLPFDFTRGDWEQLADFDVESTDITTPTLLLLDENDEVIDPTFALEKYRNLPGKTILYPGGSHSFDHLAEAIPEIQAFVVQ